MTYEQLKADILAFVNRVEIEQMLPRLIALAEGELTRLLRVRQMVGRATATLDNEYELLPADFAGVRTFELASAPRKALDYVDPDRLTALRGLADTPGEPVWYSVIGAELRFAPRPSGAYPGSQLTYWRRIPALSDAAPSNWLLQSFPDAYLYGALKHAGQALGDARTDGWARAFAECVAAINAADRVEDPGART